MSDRGFMFAMFISLAVSGVGFLCGLFALCFFIVKVVNLIFG